MSSPRGKEMCRGVHSSGSSRETQEQSLAFFVTNQVDDAPHRFGDKLSILTVLSERMSLNHSHIRCSLEGVLHILFVPNTF